MARMWKLPVGLLTVAAAMLAVGSFGAAPAAAVDPIGPPQVLVPECTGTGGDAAISSVGTVRGFAGCGGFSAPIWFFRAEPGQAAIRVQSPYFGEVLAVAWDNVSATYVVYDTGDRLWIGKRTEAGNFAAPTLLSPVGGGVGPHRADVVADGARWWAVWSEQPVAGEGAQHELFQKRTMFGVQPRTRITNTAIDDVEPTLGYAGRGVTLVWSRGTGPRSEETSDLWIARSSGDPWVSKVLATVGERNSDPKLQYYTGVGYLTWERDFNTIVVADDLSGRFTSHTFARPGADPSIGVSGGRTFVAWNGGYGIVLAQRSGQTWTDSFVTGAPAALLAVPAQGGRARLVYRSDHDIRMRTQN